MFSMNFKSYQGGDSDNSTLFLNLQNKILSYQTLIVYACIFLIIIFVLSVLLSATTMNSKTSPLLFNLFKLLNMTTISFIFITVYYKFNSYMWNFKMYGQMLSNYQYSQTELSQIPYTPLMSLNGSLLSDVIMMLAFSSGMVCLYLLGEKNVSKHISNLGFFCMFFVAMMLMVYTTNLLVMFISFELLFLPTLFFVYHHGYVERVDKTLKILLYWTLFGAFLVLVSMAYIYFKYKTLNFYTLSAIPFTDWENSFLFFAIFIGFGMKMPVTPFHYWLTKIHVEAPAGFSIFLSGFLVKAALYCFYSFNLLFTERNYALVVCVIAFFGIAEASVKMWTQTDFKKLIAFATMQEMNLMLFLLMACQNSLDHSLMLFILMHGWLSTLMFFLVDIIQKKTGTRNIVELTGLGSSFPTIKLLIWLIILLFSGFPLTVKFVMEWQLLITMMVYSFNVVILMSMVMSFIGVVGFVKQMLIMLYGMPKETVTVNPTLSSRDKNLFYLILGVLIYLHLLSFLLI